VATNVQIEHPRTGERYEVALADFRRTKAYRDPKSGDLVTYEDAGFKIVANADGTAYEEPKRDEPAPVSKPAEKSKEG
jgi:hypothetical protein